MYIIRLNRPETKNAFNQQLYDEICLSLMAELWKSSQVGDAGPIWVLDPDPVWVDVVQSQLDTWLNFGFDPLWHAFF